MQYIEIIVLMLSIDLYVTSTHTTSIFLRHNIYTHWRATARIHNHLGKITIMNSQLDKTVRLLVRY
jgi:hypothetical protein